MTNRIYNREELPLVLNANHVAATLGISRTKAYELMHSKDFPTITIGKRYVVRRGDFFLWLEERYNAHKKEVEDANKWNFR